MNQYYTEVVENKERREDGSLSYEETKAFLDPRYAHLFGNSRVNVETGQQWIRIGRCIKYNKDGSVQWRLDYTEDGSVDNNPIRNLSEKGDQLNLF